MTVENPSTGIAADASLRRQWRTAIRVAGGILAFEALAYGVAWAVVPYAQEDNHPATFALAVSLFIVSMLGVVLWFTGILTLVAAGVCFVATVGLVLADRSVSRARPFLIATAGLAVYGVVTRFVPLALTAMIERGGL